MGTRSNEDRRQLVRLLAQDRNAYPGKLEVKVVATPQYNNDSYKAICFVKDTGSDALTALKAQSVIISDRVFFALCTQKNSIKKVHGTSYSYEERNYYVKCYNSSGEELKGFLKDIDERKRPSWESDHSLEDLIYAESQVSNNMMNGSREYGFPGIRVGTNVMIRVIADNRNMHKPTVTYFFEPVITIREADEAIDIYGQREMETAVIDKQGRKKNRDYDKGDIVRDLPILTTFKTERFGTIGIGYIKRPENEFEGLSEREKQPFYLKKVWVKGGADYVGSVIKEAEIISDKKNVILTYAKI